MHCCGLLYSKSKPAMSLFYLNLDFALSSEVLALTLSTTTHSTRRRVFRLFISSSTHHNSPLPHQISIIPPQSPNSSLKPSLPSRISPKCPAAPRKTKKSTLEVCEVPASRHSTPYYTLPPRTEPNNKSREKAFLNLTCRGLHFRRWLRSKWLRRRGTQEKGQDYSQASAKDGGG